MVGWLARGCDCVLRSTAQVTIAVLWNCRCSPSRFGETSAVRGRLLDQVWKCIGCINEKRFSSSEMDLRLLDFLHHFLGPSKDWLFSNVVLPNFKCIEITSDERMLSLAACTREPIGVLKVHVCRGINLAGRAGWSVSAVPRQICYVHLLGWKTTSQDMVQNPAFSANIQR